MAGCLGCFSLAMDVSSGSAIPAFSRYITISNIIGYKYCHRLYICGDFMHCPGTDLSDLARLLTVNFTSVCSGVIPYLVVIKRRLYLTRMIFSRSTSFLFLIYY
jgi:hypothetical protein